MFIIIAEGKFFRRNCNWMNAGNIVMLKSACFGIVNGLFPDDISNLFQLFQLNTNVHVVFPKDKDDSQTGWAGIGAFLARSPKYSDHQSYSWYTSVHTRKGELRLKSWLRYSSNGKYPIIQIKHIYQLLMAPNINDILLLVGDVYTLNEDIDGKRTYNFTAEEAIELIGNPYWVTVQVAQLIPNQMILYVANAH